MQNIPYRSLTRKTPFVFPFLISVTPFSHFFNQKLFIYIHVSLFTHTVQSNTIVSSSNITYWKSGIFHVKVQSTLCWWNTRPLSLSEFWNYCRLYQGTAEQIVKLNVSTKRWNSRVEFHGKMTNLEKSR